MHGTFRRHFRPEHTYAIPCFRNSLCGGGRVTVCRGGRVTCLPFQFTCTSVMNTHMPFRFRNSLCGGEHDLSAMTICHSYSPALSL